MSKYDDLVKKLKEIFQIDRPELDFGIYRIFNTRAAEINRYLEHRLKAKVSESLAAFGTANADGLRRELQEKLLIDAVNTILNDATVKSRWLALSQREPTEKNQHRMLLEKHLMQYTTRNTADYFIHKNLGWFLRSELDFYIKNEVMHLDDGQHAEKFADIEKNLRLVQTLQAIVLDLIAFLVQLEDFQEKLWLKKKFVVATHYCITLDRIPESLDPAIAANARQWEKLGMLTKSPPNPPFSKGGGNFGRSLSLFPDMTDDITGYDTNNQDSTNHDITSHDTASHNKTSPPLKKGDLGGFRVPLKCAHWHSMRRAKFLPGFLAMVSRRHHWRAMAELY